MEQVQISGSDELNATLNRLMKNGSKAVARATMNGMATPLKQSLKRAVSAVNASSAVKSATRKTVGSSVKKDGSKNYQLKVGFGVGKQSAAKKSAAKTRSAEGQKGGGGRGVGISSQNIHWIVFGTGEHSTLAGKTIRSDISDKARPSKATGKARKTKAGKSTGSTIPYFVGLIPTTMFAAAPDALEKARYEAEAALYKEAVRRS